MSFQTKTFEVRDRNTFIPCIAIEIVGYNITPNCDLNEKDLYLARHSGYGGERYILFMRLDGYTCYYDPFDWKDRTYHTAHKYVLNNWDNLKSGQVIDVEFILEETKEPKQSEMVTAYV